MHFESRPVAGCICHLTLFVSHDKGPLFGGQVRMWWDEQIGLLRSPDRQGNPEVNGASC
jgi:hypothetical protein